jgi:hypothetical protein
MRRCLHRVVVEPADGDAGEDERLVEFVAGTDQGEMKQQLCLESGVHRPWVVPAVRRRSWAKARGRERSSPAGPMSGPHPTSVTVARLSLRREPMVRRLFWSVALLILAVGPTAACGDDGDTKTPEAAPASASASVPSDNSGQICTEWRAAYQRTVGPNSTRYADARKAAQAAFDTRNTDIGNEQAKVMAQLHAEWGVESTRLAGLAESAALKTALQAMGRLPAKEHRGNCRLP